MKLALIGVGSMGRALLDGWLEAGWAPQDVGVVVRRPEQAEQLREELGVRPIDLAEAQDAPLIVVAVKPYQFGALLQDFRPAQDSVVISVAAGVTLAQFEDMLPECTAVARVMPNTAAVVRESMSGVVVGTHLSDEQLASVTELFDAVGKTLVVPENQFDALLAIAGSGPAYVYYFADAMIEAGVHQGLSREQASDAIAQTFLGAAKRLARREEAASELRQAVTSPAGTTVAAMRKLDDHAVRAAILDAVEACRARAIEMGRPAER